MDFAALVRQHQAMVFSVAYHIVRDRAAAEDLAQEVFLQLHKSLSKLESPEHVLFWLRRTASHRAIDYVRKHAMQSVALDDAPELHAPPQHEDDPMLSKRLRKLVATLPEKSRAVVVLRYQEDMSPDEIARVLELPVGTVKSYLHRALAMLRDKLLRTVGEVSA